MVSHPEVITIPEVSTHPPTSGAHIIHSPQTPYATPNIGSWPQGLAWFTWENKENGGPDPSVSPDTTCPTSPVPYIKVWGDTKHWRVTPTSWRITPGEISAGGPWLVRLSLAGCIHGLRRTLWQSSFPTNHSKRSGSHWTILGYDCAIRPFVIP